MTAAEYAALKRFPEASPIPKFGFRVGQRFDAYTMENDLVHLIITDTWENLLFELRECDTEGNLIKRGYCNKGVNPDAIRQRLEERDWQLIQS